MGHTSKAGREDGGREAGQPTEHTAREHMRRLVATYGWERARRETVEARDRNAEGSASFAFLNAVVKQFDLGATVGPLTARQSATVAK